VTHREIKGLDRQRLVAVTLIVLAVLTIPASKALGGPDPTAEHDDVSMALIEAMEYAVGADPRIRLAEQFRISSFGVVEQNAGPFNTKLGFKFSYDGGRSYLNEAQLHGENQKRTLFRELALISQQVADDLQEQLGGEDFVWADCPPGLVDFTVGDTNICISGRTQAIFELYQGLADAINYEEVADGLVRANLEAAGIAIDALNANAIAQRANLRNIGTVPTVLGSLTTAFDLRFTKLFRNGIVLEPGLILDGFQENYVGKPAVGAFGGKGTLDSIRSIVGVTVDIPLGKGRGKVSTAASENAAKESAEAALADEAFAITLSVENTALAYWDLAASQALLELLQETERIQVELLAIGEALVEAEEYAEADLHFVRGRLELTRGRAASAQEDVVRARVALADVMGQSLFSVDQAPMAADALPEVPAEDLDESLTIEAMVEAALQRRFDLAAARYRRGAAEFLARGAAFDLKRRVDLQMAVGYAGLYEFEGGGDIMRFDDLTTGWWEALSDFSAGPSFKLGLTFELPFGNRVARGRSVQNHALQQQSRIELRDLERTIANEIERITRALEQAIQEGRRRVVSVKLNQETLTSEIELYRGGEGSSIDVILTQETLVSEEVLLVSARRTIAFLATQLSFETGRLVDCRIADDEVTVMAFYPAGDVGSLGSDPVPGAGRSGDGSE
jgi:outer membrane protein TolC